MTLSPRTSFRAVFSFTLLVFLSSILTQSSFSQSQSGAAGKRRVLQKTEPAYPPLARAMGLSGVVKLDVTVSPDGSVKAVEVKGGHPVLADAAASAVRQWRWERGQESHESVEVRFSRE